MNGTIASGIRDFVVYSDSLQNREVPMINMEDACREFGCVPSFIKMDIEGAELAFVKGAKEFLNSHHVNLAIESYHRVEGELTYKRLGLLFA
jgi:FkbM family methyltransferase